MRLRDVFYKPQPKDEHVFEVETIDPWASSRAVYQNYNLEKEESLPASRRSPLMLTPLQVSQLPPVDQARYLGANGVYYLPDEFS